MGQSRLATMATPDNSSGDINALMPADRCTMLSLRRLSLRAASATDINFRLRAQTSRMAFPCTT
jgi:hypothetical protein